MRPAGLQGCSEREGRRTVGHHHPAPPRPAPSSTPLPCQVFDLMGYPPSHTNKINIHVGAVHGSKPRSLARFAAAVERLSDGARARLTGARRHGRPPGTPCCMPQRVGAVRRALGRGAAHPACPHPTCFAPAPLPAVENDDRPSQFSLDDLLPLHAMAGTPLVFDYLHHALVPGRLSEQEALFAALDTWPPGVRPVVHYRCVPGGVGA